MKKSIAAARTVIAIKEIARKTGIDVDKKHFPKGDTYTLRMHQLEKLANDLPDEMPDQYDVDIERILESIKQVKGVGDHLYAKIEKELLG